MTTPATYSISGHIYGILRDSDKGTEFYDLEYHLEKGDYLGVLATILGFCIDTEHQEVAGSDDYQKRLLEKTRHDLAVLHATHTIVPRKTKE